MEELVRRLGYFSEMQKREFGSCWWTTPDGGTVEITDTVVRHGDCDEPREQHWPDEKYVGIVEAWSHGYMVPAHAKRMRINP